MESELFLFLLLGVNLICHPPSINAKDWLLMGGFRGVEGEVDTSAVDNVEILSLSNQAQYKSTDKWCQVQLPPADVKLEGATMTRVSMFNHMENMLANDNTYTSPHSSVIWEKILLCGGAQQDYDVSKSCYWWTLQDNVWSEGPKMLFARQRAASLVWNGMIWMLGGREGSKILQHNE